MASKGYILHVSIYITFSLTQNYREVSQPVFAKGWGLGENLTAEGDGGNFLLCLNYSGGPMTVFVKMNRTMGLKV